MSRKLRVIASPFVVAPSTGARVRTRLRLSSADEAVLRELGSYLGRLAGADLARRCGEGRVTADGEADKAWGNETIRWHPDEGWLEVKLPVALAHLANRPHGRYRLSAPVSFPYRGDEVAAQATSGAIRYDIAFRPDRGRWYLDASWTTPPTMAAPLDDLRRSPVLAVDLDAGHLAALVVDPSGNPMGAPVTVPLDLAGLRTPTRDGRLRGAISRLIALCWLDSLL